MKTKSKHYSLLLLVLMSNLFVNGQNKQHHPYEKFGGEDVQMLTLSNGKYNEFFDTDTLQVIGSAVLNTKTMTVIGYMEQDTLFSEATLEPEVASRWLSLDPLAAKYPNISPYVFVGNSPIMLVDPDGKRLVLAGHRKKAFRDVKSLLTRENRKRLSYDKETGLVTFDANGIEKADFDGNSGLQLVNDLVVSEKAYQYSVSNTASYQIRGTKELKTEDLTQNPNGVANVSTTPRLERTPGVTIANENNDGEITILPKLNHYEYDENGELVKKNRASEVFHELQENYERTENGHPYMYEDPNNIGVENPNRKGAHGISIDKEDNFHKRSNEPGKAKTIKIVSP